MGRAACLTTENHLRGRLPVRVTPALPYCRAVPNDPTTPNPEGNGTEGPEVSTPVSDRAAQSRYGNIDPFIHSTTPVGLALGPDSPGDDERGPGTLGHPAAGIFTPLSLLMSAFSLPPGPRQAHAAASTATRRSPTHPHTWPAPQGDRQATHECHGFGGVLEPRYIVGAESLDQ